MMPSDNVLCKPTVSARPLAGVFVTGTGTDMGKTVVTAGLLRALRQDGVAAQAVKPVQTGVSPDRAERGPGADAVVYASAVADLPPIANLKPGASLHCFALPASPYAAASAENASLDVSGLKRDIESHWATNAALADFLLLEGAGGLRVPLNEREDLLDLMVELDLPVLLTAGNYVGALNHTLLSLAAMQSRGVRFAGLVFIPLAASGKKTGTSQEANILRKNVQIVRARLEQAGCFAPVVELPWLAERNAAGWRQLADVLAPLAESLWAARSHEADVAALLRQDHCQLWHPYASAVQPPELFIAERTRTNRIVGMDGHELIDGMSSWWAAIHGYNHPQIIGALRAQASRMPHIMFGGISHAPAVNLAGKLLDLVHDSFSRVFFVDSGSVAVEVALKMALQYHQGTGSPMRTRFLAPRGGYHGDTFGAMSVCDPDTGMHNLFTSLVPQQLFMERPSCRFDGPFDPASLDDARRIFAEHGPEIAAVIFEPIVQGAGGMWFYHPEYVRGIEKLCREAGCLLIFDEIATGFGRTGKMFAAEWAGVWPDILCCGKALTGGVLSLAAAICNEDVMRGVCAQGRRLMHGPTFMANPLACAVACASLDVLHNEDWQSRVAALEKGLQVGLAPCRDISGVVDVRVLGGIGVVETDQIVNASALHRFFVQQNVWIRPFNRLIYLIPPYSTPAEDVQTLCVAVLNALRQGVHLA